MNALDRLDLTDSQRPELARLLAEFDSRFDAVIAFGSRATGRARPGSDLDLAVVAPQDDADADALRRALDESALPFFSDVVVMDSHLASGLREAILRDGIALAGRSASEWRKSA